MSNTLFTPATLGKLQLKNRIVRAPLTRSRATGNVPKNERNRNALHLSVSRFFASTVCPDAASHTFCLVLLPQPGFS